MNTVFHKDEVAFTSDTHFGHSNIIKYCERPFKFPDISEMDKLMLEGFMNTDAQGKTIFHMGDFVFNPKTLLSTKWRPTGKHYIVLGNHDKYADEGGQYRGLYREFFHYIIGTSKGWRKNHLEITVDGVRCILTHEPTQVLGENEYNIYGHHHNNMFRNPTYFKAEYGWIFGSTKHINVGVELTHYRPVSWDELFNLSRV